MNDSIKIVLVDDEVLFRKGILFLLDREEDVEVVHEAANGFELLTYLQGTKVLPHIVLTDLKMPVLDGVEATKILAKDFPAVKIIALTSYDSNSFIRNMIDIGASSYIVKNASPQELVSTIREVADKGFFYNDNVLKIIQDDSSVNTKNRNTLLNHFLTNREVEILQLICEQKTTAEIADVLSISPRTVEGHRNNLLLKTESKNIAGLVVYAIQNNIVRTYN
ncbi:MAG: response regulator transcription factor [Flavobacteriaceae bacterium]|jgi:DNA-binding NarL/FixJ family response regulator|uniref:Response regulator transcription factor n=1 Tax=Flavobacterium kayseriense TaxID=2764714 RepID=A0ABR7J2P1_9FLAO|nr:response regulator transcription factor [Flavobacterium kayseriense]MBC5839791.1 response regulator transcription factor [Flavobacterium kayseriense]MBC5847539.1 response regulator transcription factor [Flavobacterium kayseriense]MBU0940195.1 response regulator transcription factor [Bacteroidota bacterium]MBX9889559.1 response regulator transcription factor [Flavobacteriaceae bacterium]